MKKPLSGKGRDVEVFVDSGIPGRPLIALGMEVGEADLAWMAEARVRSVELARARGHLRS
ncbi:hypothetical protein [Longimicrobium sp.]|uniref:hypothetical protein n=1 Tax=Longimicrobium sp. TaxID=2029185 RepID=UPI002EDB25D2